MKETIETALSDREDGLRVKVRWDVEASIEEPGVVTVEVIVVPIGISTATRHVGRAGSEADAIRAIAIDLGLRADGSGRASAQRVIIEELKSEIEAARAIVTAVRHERDAREAWLRSLPEGSCTTPPTAALIEAEAATGEALRKIEGKR